MSAKEYGLLEPLEALKLGADELSRVTAAAVAYCDAKGSGSVADLVERASRLITTRPQAVLSSSRLWIWSSWP